MSKSNRLTTRQVWGAPILLGALSALGLITALVSDSLGDVLAWLSLAVPVVVVAWYSRRK